MDRHSPLSMGFFWRHLAWHSAEQLKHSGAIFNLKYLDKNEIKYVGIEIIVHTYHI